MNHLLALYLISGIIIAINNGMWKVLASKSSLAVIILRADG